MPLLSNYYVPYGWTFEQPTGETIMCCNCNNNNQKPEPTTIYFDTLNTDEIDLSPTFKAKRVSDLNHLEIETLVRFTMHKGCFSQHENALSSVFHWMKSYDSNNVSWLLDRML